jgi:hypothetical protein
VELPHQSGNAGQGAVTLHPLRIRRQGHVAGDENQPFSAVGFEADGLRGAVESGRP